MTTTIVKWGNSHGIRLPKKLLESVDLSDNDLVDVITEDGKIIIKKYETKKSYKSIQERFKYYDGDYEPIDIDWGKPVDKEIW